MIFSQKVRLLRKKNGFTQEKFAKEIGVSRQSVYKWEDGQAYPEVEKLVKMRRVFSVSIDDLLDDGMSVSDDGTLKTNAEVEFENAHKKKRKPRKDKGIKTGIPPMRKNGEPVVRRKKPVEEPLPAVSEIAAEAPAAPVVEPTPAVTPAPAPAAPAAPARPAQPSFRTRRAAPSFTHRDAASAARAEIAARRMNRGNSILDDEDLLMDDEDLLQDDDNNLVKNNTPVTLPAVEPTPVVTAAPAPAAPAAPAEPVKTEEKKPREKRKVGSLFNSEEEKAASSGEATEASPAPAPVKNEVPEKKTESTPAPAPAPAPAAAPETAPAEEPKPEEKKRGGFFSLFRRK